ncbi:MAG: GNAT family N-acetyltransferase [Rikenellaceae bacterium]
MYKFYPASLNDIPTIQDIAHKTFFKTYQKIVGLKQLEWMFDWMYSTPSLTEQMSTGHNFFLLHEDDIPVGFISIQRTDTEVFCFQKIYLLPSSHGQGLGRKLLDLGFAYVKGFNLKNPRIELHVNRENKALKFYQHIGFEIASQGDYEVHPGYFMNDYIMAIHPFN